MSEKIVTLNEEVIKGQLKELVRGSVEETLNELLEQEAEKLTQAARIRYNKLRKFQVLSIVMGTGGRANAVRALLDRSFALLSEHRSPLNGPGLIAGLFRGF